MLVFILIKSIEFMVSIVKRRCARATDLWMITRQIDCFLEQNSGMNCALKIQHAADSANEREIQVNQYEKRYMPQPS